VVGTVQRVSRTRCLNKRLLERIIIDVSDVVMTGIVNFGCLENIIIDGGWTGAFWWIMARGRSSISGKVRRTIHSRHIGDTLETIYHDKTHDARHDAACGMRGPVRQQHRQSVIS
jgi:hypothetical protein